MEVSNAQVMRWKAAGSVRLESRHASQQLQSGQNVSKVEDWRFCRA